jgi:glutamyl-tRNA synthetase
VLDAAVASLAELPDERSGVLGSDTSWTAAAIEAALRSAVVEGLGLKPKLAFGPLRTAVSGRRVSPPLFESMEILGKTATLTRLHALRAQL